MLIEWCWNCGGARECEVYTSNEEVLLIRAVSLRNTYAEVAMLPGLVLQSAA